MPVFAAVIGGEHVSNEALDILWIRSYVCTHSHPFVSRTKAPSDIITNICNEHFMQEEHKGNRKLSFLRFCFNIFGDSCEILRFKEFAFAHETVEIYLKKDLFCFFERECTVFNRI